MNDLIKQLQENKLAFCYMSKEMREKAKEIGPEEFRIPDTSKGQGIVMITPTYFASHVAYTLRQDYEPVEEYVEYEIFCDSNELCYSDGVIHANCIHFASTRPNFAGFRYEDGIVRHDSLARKHKVTGIFADCILYSQLSEYEIVRPYPNGSVVFSKNDA